MRLNPTKRTLGAHFALKTGSTLHVTILLHTQQPSDVGLLFWSGTHRRVEGHILLPNRR